MSTFKPMLAATVDDITKLQFPLFASYKLDGIRAIVQNGVVVSRSLKPIPNGYVQHLFGRPELEGFDGELIFGDPTNPSAFRDTTSAVMTKTGRSFIKFHVFDSVLNPELPFHQRLLTLCPRGAGNPYIIFVSQTEVNSVEELNKFEYEALQLGYEGVMLRHKAAAYKYGRSTFKEHGLMKLKQFNDAEAKIIGFDEQMHNMNESKLNKLGVNARSTKKDGMVGKQTLGALKVIGLGGDYSSIEFNVGTGFDDVQRADIWKNQGAWMGKIIKYKFFPLGSKNAPRFPVFIGVRDQIDL